MKWILLDFKSAKEEWFDCSVQLYTKKIKPFVHFEVQHLKTMKADRDESALKKNYEEKVLLEKISTDDFVILLDEKGTKTNSLVFAETISKAQQSGKKRGVLIIGGAYGVSDKIKDRSNLKICLSDLTLNHLVAELVLLEQFYRAQTILHRIPYHNL